jgi:glycosyltransferase involved in cell wall biosynthesis
VSGDAIGANDPCPCDSGETYAACCGRNASLAQAQTQANTSDPAVWRIAGQAALLRGDLKTSEKCCRRAVELDKDDTESLYLLGTARARQRLYEKALAPLKRAISLNPGHWRALNDLGNVYREIGQHQKSAACLARLFRNPATPTNYLSNALLGLQNQTEADHGRLFALYCAVGRRIESEAGPPLPAFAPKGSAEKIRLGYYSPRFKPGVIGDFFLPLFDAHDRRNFEIHLFSDLDSGSNPCARYLSRHADHWTDTKKLTDRQLAEVVNSTKIDIFIDLAGHSPGHRLGAFACKPAPIQISMLDSFDTTGMAAFDYFVSDRCSTPVGSGQRFAEKLLLLSQPRLVYRPTDRVPSIAPLPAQKNGFVTFGSFNRAEKITAHVLVLWANILSHLPDARLILKAKAFDDSGVVRRYQRRFGTLGVGPERIEFRGWSRHRQLLSEYGDIDIGLDTFPYNGGLTTCEALWMGVPVITLEGARIISRQGACFMRSLGLEEFVSQSTEEYGEMAVEWGNRIEALTDLRASLRNTALQSPMMDAAGYAREFEHQLMNVLS